MKGRRGFTVVEVVVAIVVLAVGILAVAGTSALATRLVTRSRNRDLAVDFAQQRLERLRLSACTSQANGADTLFRAGIWAAINTWTFTNAGNSTWRLRVIDRYKTVQGSTHSDTLETSISCLI